MSPKGNLFTKGPGAYKIPGFGDIPMKFNVFLLKNSPNLRAVYRSKVRRRILVHHTVGPEVEIGKKF